MRAYNFSFYNWQSINISKKPVTNWTMCDLVINYWTFLVYNPDQKFREEVDLTKSEKTNKTKSNWIKNVI